MSLVWTVPVCVCESSIQLMTPDKSSDYHSTYFVISISLTTMKICISKASTKKKKKIRYNYHVVEKDCSRI